VTALKILKFSILLTAFLLVINAFAVERFPPPDFESGYQMPSVDFVKTAEPKSTFSEYMDLAVLMIALVVTAWLVLKIRKRAMIFAMVIFALAYFGFYRAGCVCPIGAIQNFSLAMFDSGYSLPIFIGAFLILPIIFTLFFGRIFCSAVCPLGAVQDAVLLRPVKLPLWLEAGLRLIAYLYLGLAVLFASAGASFIICRYDPFISIFRLNGLVNLVILTACFVLISMFIGRPYCRFLCPLGVIFRHSSALSRKRVTITPDECIKCRLCEDACPFNAIDKPTADWPNRTYSFDKVRLLLVILLLPVIITAGVYIGSVISGYLAGSHQQVRLAERIHNEDTGQIQKMNDASKAFRSSGTKKEKLFQNAQNIRAEFKTGSMIFGGYMGLVISASLIKSSIRKKREFYEANRASCFACGRCFDKCPREQLRRQNIGVTKKDNDG
jgi:NAD-dependent dihydropyrimidine dehydrogenase PreA subunit